MLKWLFMNRSIRIKIVWSSILISLVPLLVLSYLFYQSSTKSLERSMVRSSDLNAEYLSDNLDQYFRNLSTSALQVYGFKRVIDLMENGTNYNDANIIEVRESLASYYRLVVNKNSDVIKIIVLGNNNVVQDSWTRADSYDAIRLNDDVPYHKEIVDLPFQHSLMFTYHDPAIQQDLFVYAMTIYDPFYKKKYGSLIFYVKGKDFAKMMEKYNRSPNVIVLQNDRKEVFYQTNNNYAQDIIPYERPDELSDSNEHELHVMGKQNLLISNSLLDHSNIGLSIVYPNTELQQNRRDTLKITVVATFLVMLVIALFSFLAQQFITRPIQYLGKAMRNVRSGNFNVTLKPNPWQDDLSELTSNFNFMTEKIRDLIETEYTMQLRNKEAQLMALQMQINPHFLYNTLQTIGGKAILLDDYEIYEMCRALGDMFRYSFYEGNMESTLGLELAHLNNYLYIQQLRFEDSLQIEFDVDSQVMNCHIIRFVLQPIMENIIVHGMDKEEGHLLRINVSAERNGEDVLITIRDNGPGIAPEKLSSLRKILDYPLASSEVFTGISIGLRNVHERIKLFYGPSHGIRLESQYGQGTTVYITIPCKIQEEGQHV